MDVGGTFTDAVLAGDGAWHTAKVPTTPGDESRGVMAAIAEVLAQAGAIAGQVQHFGHGMTVATNALLEERGARTALVTTAGFADVIEIARQARPELYRPCQARPAPLVPRELRLEVRERTAPEGPLVAPDDAALGDLVEQLRGAAPDSVAVSLLHSYAHPEHEQRVAAAVRDALPAAHISVSHEVARVFREYERTSTTVIDAYLSPLLARYLGRLSEAAAAEGLPEPEIMRSSGGLMSAAAAARNAAWAVLSGPAAGTVGAADAGRRSGSEHVISFDMGGTSCDVAVIESGRPLQAGGQEVSGRVIVLPMVDVHTVGAGGGSIGWADPGGALRVGPRSAGARPGPAAYGHGGTEPTVTDANLLLGYLGAGSSLAGGVSLDADAAGRAVAALAATLGMSSEDTAWGIARVADEEMVRALRVVTVERGIDPRRHALVAFGGAGPMHALRIADQLGIRRVLCPRGAGVLSALGLVVADRRRDVERTVLLDEEQLLAGERSDAGRGRRGGRSDRAARRAAGSPFRPALPRAVARAQRPGAGRRPRPDAAGPVRAGAHGPLRLQGAWRRGGAGEHPRRGARVAGRAWWRRDRAGGAAPPADPPRPLRERLVRRDRPLRRFARGRGGRGPGGLRAA